MKRLLIFCLLAAMATTTNAQDDADIARRLEKMVEMVSEGVRDKRVLKVVGSTQRHLFVPQAHQRLAYLDLALPIGHSATISPPYIVAYMTEQLDPQPSDRVLEIGTGSGYQAAILSPLVKDVYSIEIIKPLGRQAAERLKKLGYDNVHCKVGDGFKGWREHAPFDKIIVTCSPEKIPQPLIDQLREGGRMVIPLGGRYDQSLCLMRKENGKLRREVLESTFFIPMTGRAEELRLDKSAAGPRIRNGGFDELGERQTPKHWFYLRQFEIVPQTDSAKNSCIKFHNETPGRMAQALQAFGVDGLTTSEIEISARVRVRDVKPGDSTDDRLAAIEVWFFEADRRGVGSVRLGPFRGTSDWKTHRLKYRVPLNAKLAVLGIGLFGGVGEAYFDDVTVTPLEEN